MEVTFSIKDLEQLSGIKAHTIRIWEQRYKLFKPKRTDTNIRYYNENDLRLILNISLLKNKGFKISKIANMSEGEIQSGVMDLMEQELAYPEQINALTISMVNMDEEQFEKIISSNILKIGFEKTMLNIVYPFLARIGTLWQVGAVNPAQEHFISNLIRQKLMVAIDGLYVPVSEKQQKFILFLPDEELHELSLLFSSFVIKSRKHKSIYLGQSLPLKDLEAVYRIHRPQFLMTILTTTPTSFHIQEYLDTLSNKFPESTILLSGAQIVNKGWKFTKNTLVLNSLSDIVDFVETL